MPPLEELRTAAAGRAAALEADFTGTEHLLLAWLDTATGPLAEAVLLGNVALRHDLRDELTGKKLLWDSAALRITNSDDANQFLRREYRAGWSL